MYGHIGAKVPCMDIVWTLYGHIDTKVSCMDIMYASYARERKEIYP